MSKAHRDSDRAAGRVRFGGRFDFFRAGPKDAYREATRVLIEHALAQRDPRDLAQPCFYLLRHTLELHLKALIAGAWDIEEMDQSLKAGKVVTIPRDARINAEHDLKRLADLAASALRAIGLELPDSLTTLACDVHVIEDGDPTRNRYAHGKKPPYKDGSFPTEVTYELRAWLDRLNAYAVEHDTVRDDWDKHEERTLAEELGLWAQGLTDELLATGVWQLES